MKHKFQKDFRLGSKYIVYTTKKKGHTPILEIVKFGEPDSDKYHSLENFSCEDQMELVLNLYRPYMKKSFLQMPGLLDEIILLGL